MALKDNFKLRTISFKNYIYLLVICVISIFMMLFICNVYNDYSRSKFNSSIMRDSLTVINYNELDDYIIENKDAVLYVSVLGDEDIYNFEKKFRNKVTYNNLHDSILYLDVTDEDADSLRSKFGIDANFPYLVVYTNGKITDIYNISDNAYDGNKVIKYLNRIGVISND